MASQADLAYRLVVITHGPERTLSRTLASFRENVTPQPTEWAVQADGFQGYKAAVNWQRQADQEWNLFRHTWASQGFCNTVQAAWDGLARFSGLDWIFWLEHDFEFEQAIDLHDLAEVIVSTPHLAQMALVRHPTPHEGLSFMAGHEDAYVARITNRHPWIETKRNWTTNPSLFTRRFAVDHDWPDGPECEGHFGINVLRAEPATIFGLWGDGTPQVRHTGTRTGFGY